MGSVRDARLDVVSNPSFELLLEKDVDVTIVDAEGRAASVIAKSGLEELGVSNQSNKGVLDDYRKL
jgi:RNase H-fold protein (predicted Holliday junction resolvase)